MQFFEPTCLSSYLRMAVLLRTAGTVMLAHTNLPLGGLGAGLHYPGSLLQRKHHPFQDTGQEKKIVTTHSQDQQDRVATSIVLGYHRLKKKKSQIHSYHQHLLSWWVYLPMPVLPKKIRKKASGGIVIKNAVLTELSCQKSFFLTQRSDV